MASGLTLATRVTIGRILLIPPFALLATYYVLGASHGRPNEYLRWAALTVFLATSLTDALDGYLARLRNERTRLGTLMDPVADKLLLVAGLLLLTGPWGRAFHPHLPVWYALLVLSRDVFLALGVVVIHVTAGRTEIRPRVSGKISTVFQMLLITWGLAGWPDRGFRAALWAAAAFTLLSGAQYLFDGVRQLEAAHAREVSP